MKKTILVSLLVLFTFGISGCTTPAEEPTPDPDPITCESNQELENGVCVDKEPDPVYCAPGFVEENGVCVEEVEVYTGSDITFDGNVLMIDGQPFAIQGVNWNPVPVGGTHPADIEFLENVELDADLMQAAGINVVRTYEPIKSEEVLDILYAHGIYVINTVYSYGGDAPSSVASTVNNLKNHKAILFWAIGNEWNYNGLYKDFTQSESIDKINDVASIIQNLDEHHPVTTIYGHLPGSTLINMMPDIDVWGINVYSGATFGSLFSDWNFRSEKPMFIAEYGADAWNADIESLDEDSQAYATRILTSQIITNSSTTNASNRCLGGTIFEWNDEWWKAGNVNTQDTGGSAPGYGPYPDYTFNEEYWGIVDIYRNPRPAYYELQELYTN